MMREPHAEPPPVARRAADPPRADAIPARWLLLPLGLVLTAIGLAIVGRLFGNSIWDDAYVFVRYAGNVLVHGAVSWNPGGPATYGLTSVLFLLIVVPVKALVHADAAVVAGLSSLIAGGAFLLVAGWVLARCLPGRSPALRRGASLAVAFAVLPCMNSLAEHFVSGMDTTFALFCLTLYIAAALAWERTASSRDTAALGIIGGFLWWARPDLILYALCVPVAAALFVRRATSRIAALRAGGMTLVIAAGLAALSAICFHSPLPLPFYAKVGHLYEPAVYAAHRSDPLVELRGYLLACAPLLGIIVLHVARSAVRRISPFSPVETGLAAATTVFIVAYAFFVLQISALAHRFYYPTFPALVWLAGVSAVRLLEDLAATLGRRLRFTGANRILALVLVLAGLAALVPHAVDLRTRARAAPFFLSNSVRQRYASTWIRRTWFRLDAFSDLPDDLSMATTEFGYPAAMNPGKIIYDLSGLNDTAFAHHGFSADVLLTRYRPDVIFMPWRDYDRMLAQIYSHPSFVADYEAFSTGDLGTAMGLAIRIRSPYYGRMRQIVEEGRAHGRLPRP